MALALDDLNRVEPLLGENDGWPTRITITAPTVSLMLYPTRRDVSVTARAWQALEEKGIPILAVGASASALILITHLECQHEAITALKSRFELPEGVQPHQPGIRVVQG